MLIIKLIGRLGGEGIVEWSLSLLANCNNGALEKLLCGFVAARRFWLEEVIYSPQQIEVF